MVKDDLTLLYKLEGNSMEFLSQLNDYINKQVDIVFDRLAHDLSSMHSESVYNTPTSVSVISIDLPGKCTVTIHSKVEGDTLIMFFDGDRCGEALNSLYRMSFPDKDTVLRSVTIDRDNLGDRILLKEEEKFMMSMFNTVVATQQSKNEIIEALKRLQTDGNDYTRLYELVKIKLSGFHMENNRSQTVYRDGLSALPDVTPRYQSLSSQGDYNTRSRT